MTFLQKGAGRKLSPYLDPRLISWAGMVLNHLYFGQLQVVVSDAIISFKLVKTLMSYEQLSKQLSKYIVM